MKPFQLFSLLALFMSVSFLSCKKDDDDDVDQPAPCRITKVNYFNIDTGAPSDSAFYTYTEDKVTKVQLSNFNYTLEYSGDRVTKRNFYQTGSTTVAFFDQVTYNGDGTVSKVETFQPSVSNTLPVYRIEFVYNGGKLSEALYSSVENGTGSLEEEYVFTYTGNNITSAVYTDHTSSDPPVTIQYNYDTNTNYLTKQNQSFLIDAFFNETQGLLLPMSFSANNLTGIESDGESIPIEVTVGSDQNLRDIKLNNRLFARYTFQC